MDQIDTPDRRQGTLRLIDELSLGVALIDPPRRLGTEVHRFVLATIMGEASVHPMQELIWTKAANTLGDIVPAFLELPPDRELALQTRVFDKLWDAPLGELMKDVGRGDDKAESAWS